MAIPWDEEQVRAMYAALQVLDSAAIVSHVGDVTTIALDTALFRRCEETALSVAMPYLAECGECGAIVPPLYTLTKERAR